jgi:hypothetical protein
LGNGAGGFSAATSFGAGTNPFSVAVGDFNGDGNEDLMVANQTSNNVSVLLGDGAGSFSAATNFGVGSNPLSVAVGDFNGDGKQDLATANQSSNDVSVLLRQCPPAFSIDNVTHNEGNGGAATSFVFTVTKTGSTTLDTAVEFITQDGTATLANNDYQSNAGTLTFAPTISTMQITVLVNGDSTVEPDETFTLHLSNAVNATISNADGTGTILNDDQPAPPTPTPAATPTPTPCIAIFSENFDGVTAPALPEGWTSASTGVERPWVTSTATPASALNDAFAPDVPNKGNTELVTPAIPLPADGGILTFQNLFNMQANADGMVLEISINGGAFADILIAGGSFSSGPYTHLITGVGNPIAGRMAWSGLSGGTTPAPAYITTTVNLPAAPNEQSIRLKWRAATDINPGAADGAGVRIDNIVIFPASCGPPPPPPTATPGGTPVPTATPGSSGTPTPAATPTPTPTGNIGGGIALVEAYDLSQNADSKLANLSTRAFCGTQDNIVIAGFVLRENSADGPSTLNKIVVRGIGPSLASATLPASAVLADPTLELRDTNGTLILANNDWQDNAVQAAEIAAAGLAPSNNLESAIAATLSPGLYTALLAGKDFGTGIGLVEIYDRGDGSGGPAPSPTPGGTPPSQAVNLSTRMRVETGDRVGIGGFIITGSSSKQVLLRAIGPTLTRFGIDPALVLADPVLELHGPGAFVTIINNNWRDTQEAAIQATGIPPTNDLESAILVTLAPGAYTAIVRGNGQ